MFSKIRSNLLILKATPYMAKNNENQVIDLCLKAKSLDSSNYMALHLLCHAYERLSKYTQLEETSQEALKFFPKDTQFIRFAIIAKYYTQASIEELLPLCREYLENYTPAKKGLITKVTGVNEMLDYEQDFNKWVNDIVEKNG